MRFFQSPSTFHKRPFCSPEMSKPKVIEETRRIELQLNGVKDALHRHLGLQPVVDGAGVSQLLVGRAQHLLLPLQVLRLPGNNETRSVSYWCVTSLATYRLISRVFHHRRQFFFPPPLAPLNRRPQKTKQCLISSGGRGVQKASKQRIIINSSI